MARAFALLKRLFKTLSIDREARDAADLHLEDRNV
jgi:hypothetical protein